MAVATTRPARNDRSRVDSHIGSQTTTAPMARYHEKWASRTPAFRAAERWASGARFRIDRRRAGPPVT